MDYPKQIILKDCREVIFRLLRANDDQELVEFFQKIPKDELWYFKYDLTDAEVVRTWVGHFSLDRVIPVVADLDGRIIALGLLSRHKHGCQAHIGRVRVIVDPEFRSRRLGTWILFDIINVGVELGLERLEARFAVGPEDAAIQGARSLDFFEAATLPRYIKSRDGQYLDSKIMIKRLHAGWDDF